MGLPAFAPLWAKLLVKAKTVVTSKWFWAALLLIAVAGGTVVTLNHWKNQAVTTAVTTSNQTATIDTYKTKDAVDTRTQVIDQRFDKKREQTIKDYAHVRNQVQAAPPAERDAQAPRILIDTLNELDRVRSARDADGVPDPQVH